MNKNQIAYNDVTLDSKEELYIAWYLDELVEAGYILSWNRAVSYILSEPTIIGAKKINGHEYTPDFSITWTKKAEGIFIGDKCPFTNSEISKHIWCYSSLLEVKPSFDAHNMTRLFVLNQKWMLQKYNLYTQLVIPTRLFSSTFCPKRYLTTDKGKGVRKISEPYLDLNEYINKQSNRERISKPGKRKL